MIIVYEANSSIDANIVQDLLSMEGINSHIMGGYLEGGIGEIQTIGVIKLMVDEDDFNKARAFIKDWENQRSNLSDVEDNDDLDTDTVESDEQQQNQANRGFTAPMIIAVVMTLIAGLFMWKI